MAPPGKRSVPDKQGGVLRLPSDALYEVLLRLPAKDLCRLRAVCRPWRSLLSDPHFIAAHATRHPGPLIATGYDTAICQRDHRNEGIICDIIDLAGHVVKRVRTTRRKRVISIQVDRICTVEGTRESYQLLNPATGAVSPLPEGFAEEHSVQVGDGCCFNYLVVFGQVASTGECKVIRVLESIFNDEQLCEVFTLDGSSHARWRGNKASPDHVDMCERSTVVIDGVVYFLLNGADMDQGLIRIASFDLGTEEWSATLQGPLINSFAKDDYLSLTSLNGCCVVVHFIHASSMDLWLLMDREKGLWVKQHSIPLNLNPWHDEFRRHPFLMLNDERIVSYVGTMGLLRIYDPMTNTYTDVAEIGPPTEIGLYTGNLLSLANDAS